MFFDEFYFHRRRGLPRWEKIGHPVDSFFFLLPFLYIVFANFNSIIFLGLCLLSCLIITKDEWVHAQKCEGAENWLHSLLFIIHPISLAGLYAAYFFNLQDLIEVQTVIIAAFMLYQIVYWNFYFKEQNEA